MISIVQNRDCMEAMAEFPSKFFDLACIDPPYRDKNEPDQWLRANSGNMKLWQPSPKEDFFIELKRVSKEQIIWGGNYFTQYLEANNNWVIWHKLNEGVHFSMCEMAWSSIRKNIQLCRMLPPKDKIHPTQKPVALYDWIYRTYLPNGGKVLDTHLGSGSNRIAAHKAGNIDFWGYELDTDYYLAQEQRFSNYIAQTNLFNTDTVITEQLCLS